MFIRAMTVGVAVLLAAAPAGAQERGTVEFGVFANESFYDNKLNINDGWGGGARIGAYIFPRLSVEFDVGRKGASRPLGLPSVRVEAFAARLVGTPVAVGPLSVLVGGGFVHTDYEVDATDGVQGLLGAKLAIGRSAALRVDGLVDLNENGQENVALQAGMSVYRHPATITRVVAAAAAPVPPQPDSVSAAETRRLRAVEAEYLLLRASLARDEYVPQLPPTSAAALATMVEVIQFGHDKSTLSDSAKSILDTKVTVFRGNPAVRIVITGFASSPGTSDYNMALGLRRAEATKAYLVSRGVDPIRIEVATRGEGQLVVDGPGERAAAANRRGEFRLLVADPYLAPPGS